MPVRDGVKRALLGRPLRTEKEHAQALPRRVTGPVLGSNALSSVAYSPDEILLTLSLAGAGALTVAPLVGLAVAVVLLVVVASYRQTLRAYPRGGDYHVVHDNLGPRAGVAVAAALLLDLALTVAVSVAAAVQYLGALVAPVRDAAPLTAALVVAAIALLNLRGIGDVRRPLAWVVYLFVGVVALLAVVGLLQATAGALGRAPTADLEVRPTPAWTEGLVGAAGALLVLRAFSSGAVTLTGVEAVAERVGAFRPPRARNAGKALLWVGLISSAMLLAVLLLARRTGAVVVADPADQLLADGVPVGESYWQHPVLAQVGAAVLGAPGLAITAVATTAVLLLAAHSGFTGFPHLASLLGRDRYLPHQLHNRGDRLVYSNGILLLAVLAGGLVLGFGARVPDLIQLYLVGVFFAFTLSQAGMLRLLARRHAASTDRKERTALRRARAVTTAGLVLTAVVLGAVLATRLTRGAWITVALIVVLAVVMTGIRRHYHRVAQELVPSEAPDAQALPARVHAVVLVSRVNRPVLRALAYARAGRPSTLQAVTVAVEAEEAEAVRRGWLEAQVPVPLTVLDAPFREVTTPVVDYVRSLRGRSPRDVVVVYIPEYVVTHRWENLLHNQSARRLRSALLRTPGVVLASVPWQPEETR